MPSKIQLDENLWFLYVCLQKSDYKTIDYAAVGEITGLNPPAARMRFTRLKSKIENGTLTGTNGGPFIGGTKEKTPRGSKKRKSTAGESPSPGKTGTTPAAEEDRLDELGPVVKMRTRGKRIRVKVEDDEGEPGYLSSGGSSEYGDREGDGDVDTEEDLEDDVPVSKKRSMGARKKGMDASALVKNEQRRRSSVNPPVRYQMPLAQEAFSAGYAAPDPGDSHIQPQTYAEDKGDPFDPYYGYGLLEATIMQPGEVHSQPPVRSLANCSINPQNKGDSGDTLDGQDLLKAEPGLGIY